MMWIWMQDEERSSFATSPKVETSFNEDFAKSILTQVALYLTRMSLMMTAQLL